MNIRSRIKRIENAAKNMDVCRCDGNEIANSKAAFDMPARCTKCRGVTKPSVLVLADLSKIENFSYPVKIYAGFDVNLI